MNRTILRNCGKCALFLLILGIFLSLLAPIFQPKDNTKAAGLNYTVSHGFQGEPEDTIDVFFIGDSETYSAYSPLEMWENCGFTSYVCGTGAQTLDETYTFLTEIVECQHPKLVVLEALTMVRKMSANTALFSEASRLFPFLKNHDRWKSLKAEDFTSPVEYTHTENNKGFRRNFKVRSVFDVDYMGSENDPGSLDLLNRIYLYRILQFCESRNIQVMFLATPSTENWNYELHNAVQEFSDETGVPFLDLNLMKEELSIDWSTDSRDRGDHLNYFGAVKVCSYIGPYLAEQFDLPDHRDDSSYSASWNTALEKYRDAIADYLEDHPS